jgi:hypothetical protein
MSIGAPVSPHCASPSVYTRSGIRSRLKPPLPVVGEGWGEGAAALFIRHQGWWWGTHPLFTLFEAALSGATGAKDKYPEGIISGIISQSPGSRSAPWVGVATILGSSTPKELPNSRRCVGSACSSMRKRSTPGTRPEYHRPNAHLTEVLGSCRHPQTAPSPTLRATMTERTACENSVKQFGRCFVQCSAP